MSRAARKRSGAESGNERRTGHKLRLRLKQRAACLGRRAQCRDASRRVRLSGQCAPAECSNAARLARSLCSLASRSNSKHICSRIQSCVFLRECVASCRRDAERGKSARASGIKWTRLRRRACAQLSFIQLARCLPAACAPRASHKPAAPHRPPFQLDAAAVSPEKPIVGTFWQPIAQNRDGNEMQKRDNCALVTGNQYAV